MMYKATTTNQFLTDIPKYAGIKTDNPREIAEYVIENSGKDFEDEYDEMLDECYGDIDICGYSYSASVALYRIDKVAYDCGMSDYQDSRESDIAYEIERMSKGETEEYYGYKVEAIEEDEEEA